MAPPRPPRPSAGLPAGWGGGAPGAAARRFSPETIAAAVRALETGVSAPVVCRRFGVSDRTLYRWRRRAAAAAKRLA